MDLQTTPRFRPSAAVLARFPVRQAMHEGIQCLAGEGRFYDAIVLDYRLFNAGGLHTVCLLLTALEALRLDISNPLANLVKRNGNGGYIDYLILPPEEQALKAISSFGYRLSEAGFTSGPTGTLLLAARMRLEDMGIQAIS
ncbi:MAG: hypothetical protein WCT31_02315 [Candidatus Micrarchaeia archaeon]